MFFHTGIILAFILAAGVMAYQIGSRLSDQAIMTLVGVLCGILAGIPVSLGLLVALTRDRTVYVSEPDVEYEPAPAPYHVYRPAVPPQPQLPPQYASQGQGQQLPQIIVVAPPQGQFPQNPAAYPNYLLPPEADAYPAPMQERNFKIVGEDDGE